MTLSNRMKSELREAAEDLTGYLWRLSQNPTSVRVDIKNAITGVCEGEDTRQSYATRGLEGPDEKRAPLQQFHDAMVRADALPTNDAERQAVIDFVMMATDQTLGRFGSSDN